MFPIASPQRDSRQIGIRWQVLPTYVYQSHRHRHEIKMKSSHMYQSHRHRHEIKMKLTAHRGGFHKHNCFLARLHHRPRFIECLHDDIPKETAKIHPGELWARGTTRTVIGRSPHANTSTGKRPRKRREPSTPCDLATYPHPSFTPMRAHQCGHSCT